MLQLQRLLAADERLSHVVVMGMGEPLANLDSLLPRWPKRRPPTAWASHRRITISTVGMQAGIRRMARENIPISPGRFTPRPRRCDCAINWCRPMGAWASRRCWQQPTSISSSPGGESTFEYVLLAGVNDQPEHARQLIALLKGRPALVNIIPYNPVAGLPFPRLRPESWHSLRKSSRGGLTIHARRRKGERIDAACGH